jgi:glutathione S-transferase
MREVVPPLARALPLPLVSASVRGFNAKYRIRSADHEHYDQDVDAELTHLQSTLADGRQYLLGTLSAADFAFGVALQGLRPVPGTWFGPVCEELMLDEPRAERFADLLAWRDQLDARHGLFT